MTTPATDRPGRAGDGAQAYGPQGDRWMARWLPPLRAAANGKPVLELGCDTGGDTGWLVAQGLEVVATDIAAHALQACARAVPAARLLQHDLRTPLPFADQAYGAVIASLCLHYFDWRTTVAAVGEIHRCLRRDGLLLCRVNSIRDVLHGAGAGEEIEPRYWQQDAHYADRKRFFETDDLDRLFPGSEWEPLSREELTIRRYAMPKVAWELALRRR